MMPFYRGFQIVSLGEKQCKNGEKSANSLKFWGRWEVEGQGAALGLGKWMGHQGCLDAPQGTGVSASQLSSKDSLRLGLLLLPEVSVPPSLSVTPRHTVSTVLVCGWLSLCHEAGESASLFQDIL